MKTCVSGQRVEGLISLAAMAPMLNAKMCSMVNKNGISEVNAHAVHMRHGFDVILFIILITPRNDVLMFDVSEL